MPLLTEISTKIFRSWKSRSSRLFRKLLSLAHFLSFEEWSLRFLPLYSLLIIAELFLHFSIISTLVSSSVTLWFLIIVFICWLLTLSSFTYFKVGLRRIWLFLLFLYLHLHPFYIFASPQVVDTMGIPTLLTLLLASALSKTITHFCLKASSLELSYLLLAVGISTLITSITITLNNQ
jgi:hypothetical protein